MRHGENARAKYSALDVELFVRPRSTRGHHDDAEERMVDGWLLNPPSFRWLNKQTLTRFHQRPRTVSSVSLGQ